MGRLFLTLYLLLAAAVIGVNVVAAFIPEMLLRETVDGYYENISKGTFHLAEQWLSTESNGNTVSARVAGLQAMFGYPIALRPLEATPLDASEQARVRIGRTVFKRADGVEYLYRSHSELGTAWEAVLKETQQEHHHRLTLGTFRLIEAALRKFPRQDWSTRLADISAVFGFPVQLTEQDQVDLDTERRQHLRAGRVVAVEIDQPGEHHHYLIPETDQVLTMGPYPEPFILRVLDGVMISVLATVVAAAILFWVRPLWRGLVQLKLTSEAFGRGDFSARAAVPRRSAVGQVARTFNAMAERLETLISSHKELTRAVSHELRTPISRLRFGVEMAQSAADAATRQRYLDGMGSDLDELDALVSELLTYARFDRDTAALDFEPVALAPWFTQSVDHAWHPLAAPALERHVEVGSGEVELEPRLMARAVSNLLQNAQRYAKTRVIVSAALDGDQCRLRVDDDGPGIPAAERERVFEPFARLDPSRERGSGGFGLGLAIVQRIVQWHGGSVSVTEAPCGGARFELRWPRQQRRAGGEAL